MMRTELRLTVLSAMLAMAIPGCEDRVEYCGEVAEATCVARRDTPECRVRFTDGVRGTVWRVATPGDHLCRYTNELAGSWWRFCDCTDVRSD